VAEQLGALEAQAAAAQGGSERLDGAVAGAAPLYRQLLDLAATDAALDDAIFVLRDLLHDRHVSLPEFLRVRFSPAFLLVARGPAHPPPNHTQLVGSASQRQFVVRATIKRARALANLPA
jgi:hypothetical protein